MQRVSPVVKLTRKMCPTSNNNYNNYNRIMVVTNNCRAVNDYHPQMEVLYKLTSVLSFTMSHALLSSCNLWETASPTPGLIV